MSRRTARIKGASHHSSTVAVDIEKTDSHTDWMIALRAAIADPGDLSPAADRLISVTQPNLEFDLRAFQLRVGRIDEHTVFRQIQGDGVEETVVQAKLPPR